MASWTYITQQGDTWDTIALDVYGTEMLAGYLQQANPGYTNLVYFPAGITLRIPATPAEATAGLASPWKRAAASSASTDAVGKLILDYSQFVKGGGGNHDQLNNREKAGQHPTSAIVHGVSRQPLDELLDKLIALAESPLFGVKPGTGDVFVRDNTAES
jgi:phage tail protein X